MRPDFHLILTNSESFEEELSIDNWLSNKHIGGAIVFAINLAVEVDGHHVLGAHGSADNICGGINTH